MSVVINTNVDALKIQNILTNSTNQLSQSMQRMSSGLKINSAKDDAAGTVISARMAAQLDGNKICQNNVQNANALLDTAEGNLDVVLENITRIRDLTLEAKNGTYSTAEKQAMQDEVEQRMAEIDRISNSAKFSQLQLFGATDASGAAAGLNANGATFQVGANSSTNDTISIAGTSTANDAIFSSVKFVDLLRYESTTPAGAAIAGTAVTTIADYKDQSELDALTTTTAGDIYFNKTTGKFQKATGTGGGADIYDISRVKVANAAVYDSSSIGSATTTAGTIIFRSDLGAYQVNTDGSASGWATIQNDYVGPDVAATGSVTSTVSPYATNSAFDLTTMTSGTGSGSYAEALDALDGAIDAITKRKSLIGSYGNRLNSALDTLTTQYTNLSSAKSIITDADIASEASNFTQQQILQQVSVSLLTQANQTPSLALSLL